MSFAEYSNYDGLALAELVKKKKVKPTELVEAAIERIERLNPQLKGLGADLGLRSIYGPAKHHRPAGYQPAARLVEGRLTDRRAVCRPLRRGAPAAPTCGADRKG